MARLGSAVRKRSWGWLAAGLVLATGPAALAYHPLFQKYPKHGGIINCEVYGYYPTYYKPWPLNASYLPPARPTASKDQELLPPPKPVPDDAPQSYRRGLRDAVRTTFSR